MARKVAAGPLYTEGLTGMGSAKLVESYRLHPNAIKSLPPRGQGYLIGAAQLGTRRGTVSTDGATPVCWPRLPQELADGVDYPLKGTDERRARGLRLYERFDAAQNRKAGAR